jgi:hypothetical protein
MTPTFYGAVEHAAMIPPKVDSEEGRCPTMAPWIVGVHKQPDEITGSHLCSAPAPHDVMV